MSTTTEGQRADLVAGVPEPVVDHLVIEDPMAAMEWDVMPGTALCGFVFTTTNLVSRTTALAEGSEPCAECERRDAENVAEWLATQR